jgi:hypothetical protein
MRPAQHDLRGFARFFASSTGAISFGYLRNFDNCETSQVEPRASQRSTLTLPLASVISLTDIGNQYQFMMQEAGREVLLSCWEAHILRQYE